MKNAILTIILFVASAAQATELNYNWKADSFYHFTAIADDNISTSLMGMNVQEKFKTTTDFVLKINSVDPNGTASGMLYLINFKVQNGAGATLATLSSIPKEAVQSEMTVDKKGVFTFPKKVYLIATASGNVLAYGNADGNSVSERHQWR